MNLQRVNAAAVLAYQEAGLDIPTAYEGFPFTPPKAAPWARLLFLPANTDQRLQTVDKLSGILQIDLMYPIGGGTRTLHDDATTLLNHFKPRARFLYEGQAIIVRGSEPSQIRVENGKAMLTISVTLGAVLDRP